MAIKLIVDTTGDVPNNADRQEYGIESMSVGPSGNGGPEITLEFGSIDCARRFLAEWLHSDDVDGDLEVATAA